MASSESMPYMGLSPRGAPGIYRHSLGTRVCPKTWTSDTQTACAGTLVIKAPLDESSGIRDELWSYQDHNRCAAKSCDDPLPNINLSFRLKSKAAAPKMFETNHLPLIRLSVEENADQTKDACTTVPEDLSDKFSLGGMLTFRRGEHLGRRSLLNRLSSYGVIRRFRSEESLHSNHSGKEQGQVGRIEKQPSRKALISIVGKLPTVQRVSLKSLETMQKEKLGIHRPIVNPPNPSPQNDTCALKAGSVPERGDETNAVRKGDPLGAVGKGVLSKTSGNLQATPQSNKHGKQAKTGDEPERSDTLDGNPTADLSSPSEKPGENLHSVEAHRGQVQHTNIIDANGYDQFAHRKSADLKKNCGKKDDSKTLDTLEPHTANSVLGDSKCYPVFPSGGTTLSAHSKVRTPRKLIKKGKV